MTTDDDGRSNTRARVGFDIDTNTLGKDGLLAPIREDGSLEESIIKANGIPGLDLNDSKVKGRNRQGGLGVGPTSPNDQFGASKTAHSRAEVVAGSGGKPGGPRGGSGGKAGGADGDEEEKGEKAAHLYAAGKGENQWKLHFTRVEDIENEENPRRAGFGYDSSRH